MSADGDEVALTGGAQTEGIVRVGATVRRPRHARSDRARTVLLELAAAGFTGAPTHLGFDERDREILGFVEGSVPAGPPYNLSDASLRSAAELIREFHDVASRLPSRGEQETLCHGDLGAHNTVFRGERAVAIIDWDSVTPGRRDDDVAHAVWCFADLTEDAVDLPEQARRVRVMCDAYPGVTPAVVVDELGARFHRARAQHAAADRPRGVQAFDDLLRWLERHGAEIARA